MRERNLPEVGHQWLSCSLHEFEHRCRVWLDAEQRKIAPDTALIALICDAVGLSRENERLARRPIQGSAYRDGVIVGAQGAREETARRCAEIADECSSGCWAEGARNVAALIRREFGISDDGGAA